VGHHKNKQQQVHHHQQQQQQHLSLDADLFSRFYMHENLSLPNEEGTNNSNSLNSPATSPSALPSASDDLSFVGLKDILSVEKGNTIRSHKSGTVRGVRNRVRAGITTFLQAKTFKVSLFFFFVYLIATLLLFNSSSSSLFWLCGLKLID
jgi:hypothetical protein